MSVIASCGDLLMQTTLESMTIGPQVGAYLQKAGGMRKETYREICQRVTLKHPKKTMVNTGII